jgi:hypothetical protein
MGGGRVGLPRVVKCDDRPGAPAQPAAVGRCGGMEHIMSVSDLQGLPAIQAAYVALFGHVRLEDTWWCEFVKGPRGCGEWHPTAVAVDQGLGRLRERFEWEELKGPIRQLFQTQQAEERWFDGAAEIVALGYLDQGGVLERVGWPQGCGGDPPFDAAISVDGTGATRIALDVKPAFRAGWRVVWTELTALAQDWARTHWAGDVKVCLPEGAPLLHEVHECLPVVLAALNRELGQYERLPAGGVTLRLPCDVVPWGLAVTVTKADADVPTLLEELAFDDRLWGGAVRRHAGRKCKQAHRCDPPVPFMLLYLKPPGKVGVEMNEFVLAEARKAALAGMDPASTPGCGLWLGAGLLRWSGGSPHCALALNEEGASWPPVLAPTELVRCLRAEDVTAWPLPARRAGSVREPS